MGTITLILTPVEAFRGPPNFDRNSLTIDQHAYFTLGSAFYFLRTQTVVTLLGNVALAVCLRLATGLAWGGQ